MSKRIRSEYMKKFKDPKWETFAKCYDEMLAYRLTRRLLEHTHNPWFWTGSDSDSDSGGERNSASPGRNQVSEENSNAKAETEPGANEGEKPRIRADQVPRQTQEEGRGAAGPQPAVHGSEREKNVSEVLRAEEERQLRGKHTPLTLRDKDTERLQPQLRKSSKSTKRPWRAQRVRPAASLQLKEDLQKRRPPFALYGSGEKDADISSRKTHNVGPTASTTEIHESALRAKTRRQVERQMQTKRSEQRRAKSADLDSAQKAVQREFNPWLTEYMRCFSARSR